MMFTKTVKGRWPMACAVALAFSTMTMSVGQAGLIPPPANSTMLATGQSVKLDQLTLNQISGIVVGDKLFSNFVYSFDNNMPAPANVNVVAISDGTNIGIRFQGSFADLPGGVDSDAGISFRVTVLDTQRKINGARLASAVFLDPNTPGSFGSIDEDFTGNSPEISDILSVFNSTFGAGGSDFEDSVVFANQYSVLNVKKNINANAAALAIQPVRMTIIDQYFPQTVIPEPSSVALLVGSVILMGSRRRR